MKRHKILNLTGIVCFSGLVAVMVGNGCQEFGAWSGQSALDVASSSNQLGGAIDTSIPDPGMTVIPGAKTASVVYSNEVLNHLTACAGVATASDTTTAMYEAKKGSISVYGQANTITSPMMMAITSIAGEVCNDLINQEVKLGGRIFKNINMSANATPNNADLVDSVSRLALSCWGRNESSTERAKVIDMVNSSVGSSEAMASRKAALMVCTSMLSSLDALLN